MRHIKVSEHAAVLKWSTVAFRDLKSGCNFKIWCNSWNSSGYFESLRILKEFHQIYNKQVHIELSYEF